MNLVTMSLFDNHGLILKIPGFKRSKILGVEWLTYDIRVGRRLTPRVAGKNGYTWGLDIGTTGV